MWSKSLMLFALLATICHVTGNVKPKLDRIVPNRLQNVGSRFKILCNSQEGSKPFRFEWYKNGRLLSPLSGGNEYRIETSDDDSMFIIDTLSRSSSANYSCTMNNAFGSDSQYSILTVKGLFILSIRKQWELNYCTNDLVIEVRH